MLVNKQHWRRVVDFDYLLAPGPIDGHDLEILRVVETGAEAARLILDCYAGKRD